MGDVAKKIQELKTEMNKLKKAISYIEERLERERGVDLSRLELKRRELLKRLREMENQLRYLQELL